MKKQIIILVIIAAAATGILIYLKKKEKIALKNADAPVADPNPITPTVYNQPSGIYTPPIAAVGVNAEVNNLQATNLIKLVQAAFNLKIDGINGAKTNQAILTSGIDLSSPKKYIDKLVSLDPTGYQKYFPLKKGSKNNYVKALQLFLGLKPDGNFGAGTEAAAVKATGANTIFHKQYCELFSKYTGLPVTFKTPESGKLNLLTKMVNTFKIL